MKGVREAPQNPVEITAPETKELTIALPVELADEVATWADVNGITLDEQVRRLIEHALGRKPRASS
jgi:hypothetical protein